MGDAGEAGKDSGVAGCCWLVRTSWLVSRWRQSLVWAWSEMAVDVEEDRQGLASGARVGTRVRELGSEGLVGARGPVAVVEMGW